MAVLIPLSTDDAAYLGLNGYEIWVLPDVTISNNFDYVFKMTNGSVLVSDGAILALWSGFGIDITGTACEIVFGASSVFRSAASVASFSIIAQAGTANITNHGLISAANGVAIGLVGGGNSVFNDGLIEGGTGGVFLGTNGGLGDVLVNHGTIIAGNVQAPVFSERFNHAVQIEGDATVVTNYGLLSARAAFGAGVNIGFSTLTGANSLVENHGSITSALWYGVTMAELTNGGATLVNQGLISGRTGGVQGSDFGDVVINAGTVQGTIDLALGDDRYVGRGGVVIGRIGGGGGNDTMIGGAQDDDLGGDGGNDLVRGGAGDDVLAGHVGGDTLLGGAGDDTITGGFGRDLMTGGVGADMFVFAFGGEIGNAATTRDQIVDFTTKQDVIDFGALPGTLIYIGAAAFGAVAGQLRYTVATGLLEGDTNGDGSADFSLILGAGTLLAAGDLIL